MGIRCNTLDFHAITTLFIKKAALFLVLLLSCPAFSQNTVSLDDVKKEADRLFEDDEFTKAYKLYAQLVSNFPKDAEYNYRLGVCMIYAEPDKKKCIPYLKAAAANKEAPRDALFYLGKAYHINYQFDEAIKNYTEYKKTASAARQKKLQVDREIASCNNGKHLLSNMSDLVVLNKKQLNEADYFRSYDLKSIGGKLLVKPEEFKTAVDKKKKDKSVVFLPRGSNVVYYSSYGDNADNGRDIYTVAKLPSGNFGKPEKVKGINTEFDEDFPFLHPDGKTLYFASKGHNSMGGYDIFKTVYDETTSSWTAPVNLEFPVNSPDDDFLFVTDSLEKTAYFSTGRQSPPGKIDVLKVNTERKPIDILVIKGTVVKENAAQSLSSVISVKNLGTQEAVGTFSAADNGDYSLELPNGANLEFTVETPGLKTQTDNVSLPVATTARPYRQTISYEDGTLKIINYFNEATSDEDYLQYLKQIEKKARLEVNEGQNKLQAAPAPTLAPEEPKDTSATVAAVPKRKSNAGPEIVEENSSSTSAPSTPAAPKQNLDNKQLAAIARQDAEESQQEAVQLDRDAKDAYEVGQKQKVDAEKKLAEADAAVAAAEAITNGDEKKAAMEKAVALKTSAESELAVAEKILGLSKSLTDDAQNKRREARLNSDYAKELEKTAGAKNGTNAQSLAKLETLQKEISETSGQKNTSAETLNILKNDIEEKEKQLAAAEQTGGEIKTNLDDIRSAITAKEGELAQTRKKAAKQEITTQVEGLKAEQAEKEKQLAEKESEIKKINDELSVLKNEQDLANRIKTEDIAVGPAVNAGNAIEVSEPVKASGTASAAKKQSGKALQEKYRDKLSVADPKSVASIEESNKQLKSFNAEIDQAIALNRADLAKAKTPVAKQQINTELKQLENSKNQNQRFIASNNKLIADLNKAGQPIDASQYGMYPVAANTPAEAVSSLNKLETQLSVNESDNFDFNGYQNPQAQALKTEADAKINDAIAQQKKLKETIEASKASLANTSGPAASAPVSVEQLNKEADELQAKALELRNSAKTKEGAEKTKLLADEKALEEQVNDKYLQAAAVTREENSKLFAVNNENIEALIRENKSTPEDIATAKRLNEEAAVAYKQAMDIRREAESQTNKGALLGSMSNAEEKEAEAALKQMGAVELLQKANPNFALKTPAPPATAPAPAETTAALNEQLDAVNKNLADLVNTKIESYQKLYDANNLELEQMQNNIKNRQAQVDNTPSLKTDLISSNTKTDNAKALKAKADESANAGDKLKNLVAAIKKQNEAVKQVAALSTKLENTAPAVAANNPPAAPETGSSTQPASTGNAAADPAPGTVQERTAGSDAGAGPEASAALEALGNSDTTGSQIVRYFNTNSPELKNQKAGNLARNSITQLKAAATEEKALDDEIAALQGGSATDAGALKSQADNLLTEADQLSAKAQEARTEANSRSGAEKEELLTKAKSFDAEAQGKTMDAAGLTERAHEASYKANAQVIDDLLAKLKTDNPSLFSELDQKNDELTTQRSQARALRSEANALDNNAARIGAIGNAEEKETELLQKQEALTAELKKQYPDYVAKTQGPATAEVPESLLERKKAAVEKQYAELTNLTNAFSLEYESSKNAVPKNLNTEQATAKKKAESLNAESKRLLIRASGEKNEREKIRQLTLAAKAGNAAITELQKLLPGTTLPAANGPENTTAPAETTAAPAVTATTPPGPAANPPARPARNAGNAGNVGRNAVKIAGLEITQGNAYTAAKPIPVNGKMEDGLVFRVQIGAFKVQLPDDAFRGLSPLNAETTANGYYRYTAGNFSQFEIANAVKNDLRGLGYSDAFVVGYYNGKRITISEAMALLNKEGKTVDIASAPQSAGITANANVPRPASNPAPATTNNTQPVTVTRELEQSNGLLYTIQIGVYAKASQQTLLNLRPIFTERLPGGLFRYTAGIYSNADKLIADKRRVVDLGIRDAFVTAYLNGKRIPFGDARSRQETDQSIKMEPENPIVFPGGDGATNLPAANPSPVAGNPNPDVRPFSNGVQGYPAATAENGVKNSEEGVTFKVQVGAYNKQVPADVAEKLSAIKTWPVENKFIGNLYVYNIGNFSEARFAKSLKEEAVRLGLTDAFITVYKDGQKLYGADATQYLNR